MKTQIEKICMDVRDVLQQADMFDETQRGLFIGLTENEIKKSKGFEEVIITSESEGTLPERLSSAAKAVRLAGEYPYYIAQVIAFWFAEQTDGVAEFISSNGIDAAIKEYCGIEYELELIRMVADSFDAPFESGLADLKKIELMKEAYRLGHHYEKKYRGCAQCHMAALSDITGKEDLVMFRAANGLAAGMGLLGDGVCGGYSGGILSLGMFAGRRKEFFDGDKEEKDTVTLLVGKLHEKYIATFGSVICHDIHRGIFGRAFHITKPEDKEAFEKAGAHTLDKCPAVVGISAAWTAEILYDEGFLKGKDEIG